MHPNEPPIMPRPPKTDAGLLAPYLQKIATGPERSRDLSEDDAREAMALILAGVCHPVQTAVFLIALRMKRETDEENAGVLAAIRAAAVTATARVPDLVDVSEPYDGFLRHLPASPFLPAVLAACGVPAVSHGLERVGPKFGVTHRLVLQAAGAPVDLTPGQAAARIAEPAAGWAYVDQRRACPPLHALADLRTLIVKRPCISTVEGLVGPVRAAGRTHLVRGYVHEGYKRTYQDLARRAGFTSALIVRGMEGGVMPLLNKPVNACGYDSAGCPFEYPCDPAEVGIHAGRRAADLPEQIPRVTVKGGAPDDEDVHRADLARAAADAGLRALSGEAGRTRESLVLAGALCLRHTGHMQGLGEAAETVRRALDSGRARAHFQG